jgi:hypothetical protein
MKKHILLISIFCVQFFAFSKANEPVKQDSIQISEPKVSGDKYRVTAETRNLYGKNYWVDLVVEGSIIYGTRTIYGVYYDDGFGLKRISHSKDYEYENTYYVYIESTKYYFKF